MYPKILTKTEHQLIRLKMQGLSRKEIADLTSRSPGTIQRHFQNVYAKLHIQNEIELYNWYVENVLEINIKKMLEVVVCLTLMMVAEAPNRYEYKRATKPGLIQ